MFSSASSEVNEDSDPSHPGLTERSNALPAVPLAELPILDLAEFQLLEDQVDNPLIARTFAGDFAKLWVQRYEILATAVEHGDVAAALNAVLSLRTSSTMVGGVRLADLAAQLEEHIRKSELREARPLLKEVAECGHLTVQELKDSYVLRND
ncbi:Hpt domain-containing protein [Arthrobacter bambusae]|uniref:Hpt domain-containing protein n=1 Tax=Arthrobacter bambusae TaxID=1338426 RepID=UPI00277E8EE1|nr:Hpt domain-containing protein [Arthrobacter bambusae]MDQ0031404.1 HPt (histidine-containing phosphotransfer) domain-containing protein [Arthrobacter bambusae]MDQ0099707.1 HPt (histidine-containing phosphotransfer) domain-containing protein [Arthrobacter bambusae]